MPNILNKQGKNIRLKSDKPVSPLLQSKTSDTTGASEDEETRDKEIQFKVELAWCQDYIRREFESAKTDKRKESLRKALNLLTSPKVLMVRKRQVMSQFCGDYRKAMCNELTKTSNQACQGTLRNVSSSNSTFKPEIVSVCVKKHQQTSNKSQESTSDFKFNF